MIGAIGSLVKSNGLRALTVACSWCKAVLIMLTAVANAGMFGSRTVTAGGLNIITTFVVSGLTGMVFPLAVGLILSMPAVRESFSKFKVLPSGIQ